MNVKYVGYFIYTDDIFQKPNLSYRITKHCVIGKAYPAYTKYYDDWLFHLNDIGDECGYCPSDACKYGFQLYIPDSIPYED